MMKLVKIAPPRKGFHLSAVDLRGLEPRTSSLQGKPSTIDIQAHITISFPRLAPFNSLIVEILAPCYCCIIMPWCFREDIGFEVPTHAVAEPTGVTRRNFSRILMVLVLGIGPRAYTLSECRSNQLS